MPVGLLLTPLGRPSPHSLVEPAVNFCNSRHTCVTDFASLLRADGIVCLGHLGPPGFFLVFFPSFSFEGRQRRNWPHGEQCRGICVLAHVSELRALVASIGGGLPVLKAWADPVSLTPPGHPVRAQRCCAHCTAEETEAKGKLAHRHI